MRRLLAVTTALWGPVASCSTAIGDPLPPPPRCQGLAATMSGTGIIEFGDTITVRINPPTAPGAAIVAPPHVYALGNGVQVASATFEGAQLVVVLKVKQGADLFSPSA